MLPSDFLLTTKTGRILYKSVKELPIVDYHNHLSLSQLAGNHRFTTPYELWLEPDPYKHRAMRMCGVEEEFITGSASPEEKFVRWCETVPKLTGNVMVFFAGMEWQAVFSDIPFPTPENAAECYRLATEYLMREEITVEALCRRFGAEMLCPCISPLEKAEDFHAPSFVIPSLRCDEASLPSSAVIQKLEREEERKIQSLADYKAVLRKRLEAWGKIGAKFADHALDAGFIYYEDDGKNEERFQKLLAKELEAEDRARLLSHLTVFLCREEARLGMVAQFHLGAQRFTSSRLRRLAGAAGGYAGMGSGVDAESLCALLDSIEKGDFGLPKTVLFPLNPSDNAMISTLSGSYSKDGVAGLVTQGPAWWWCDHKQGMEDMLEHTAVFGVLSNFIGMTTDSRSFLSLVRHDYFRRVLCDWVGKKAEQGDFPESIEVLTELVKAMSYGNIKNLIQKGE